MSCLSRPIDPGFPSTHRLVLMLSLSLYRSLKDNLEWMILEHIHIELAIFEILAAFQSSKNLVTQSLHAHDSTCLLWLQLSPSSPVDPQVLLNVQAEHMSDNRVCVGDKFSRVGPPGELCKT